MGDILRTKVFKGNDWEFKLNYTLQALAWSILYRIHLTLKYSPGEMAYTHDMFMQQKVDVD
eukprot:3230103-Ditylum_brightwellii.AAC.1